MPKWMIVFLAGDFPSVYPEAKKNVHAKVAVVKNCLLNSAT